MEYIYVIYGQYNQVSGIFSAYKGALDHAKRICKEGFIIKKVTEKYYPWI